MRYNRKFIEARFQMAMKAIGAPTGDTYTKQPDGSYKANVGVHFIDHIACYGGYTIACMASDGGAESRPFGHGRYKASEFVAMLDGIIGAASIMKP